MLGLDIRRLAVRQKNVTFPSHGKKKEMSFRRIFKKNVKGKKYLKQTAKCYYRNGHFNFNDE